MSRGVQWSIFGSVILAALIALAGCSHYWIGEREAWRRDAEVSCLSSGVVKETPERVRISAINGPGMCGMDFPLRVSALGAGAPLGYDEEPLRPPNSYSQRGNAAALAAGAASSDAVVAGQRGAFAAAECGAVAAAEYVAFAAERRAAVAHARRASRAGAGRRRFHARPAATV